jgi:hypothetical protein
LPVRKFDLERKEVVDDVLELLDVLGNRFSFIQAKTEEARGKMDFGVACDGMVVRMDLVPSHFGRADTEEEAVDEGGVDGEPDEGGRKVVGLEPAGTGLLPGSIGDRGCSGARNITML